MLGILIAMAAAPGANADPPRQRADFFGMNIPASHTYDAQRLDAMADEISSLGFGVTRITFAWAHMQYERGGAIDWTWTDRRVGALARKGVRVLPSLFETPAWAVRPFQCPATLAAEVRTKCPPAEPSDFGWFAGHVARRYGTGGDFWKLHNGGPGEDAIPAVPVREIEIWNEPNGEWAFYPKIDPPYYGKMYRAALYNINGLDPSITVLAGALAPVEVTHEGWMAYPEFLDAMDLTGVEAISMHPYLPAAGTMAYYVRRLRAYMDSHYLGTRSIYLTEWGWPSEEFLGDDFRLPGLHDTARGEFLHSVVDRFSRSDCDVAQMAAFAWDTTDRWDAWGRSLSLTTPSTTGPGFNLLAETQIFRDGIAQLRGAGPVADRATIHDCDRQPPDRDLDGVEDQHDYAPLDPAVHDFPVASAPAPASAPYLRDKSLPVTQRIYRTTLGTWSGSPLPQMGVVRWEHCAPGPSDCQPITASATQALTIPDSAAGRQVRAVVRAQNKYGSATGVSELTGVVHTRPLNRVAPPLESTYKVGTPLIAGTGTWFAIPPPLSTTFRFFHCNWNFEDCVAIGQGGTSDSTRLLPQHANRWMKVQVTVTNALGSTVAEGFGERVTAT